MVSLDCEKDKAGEAIPTHKPSYKRRCVSLNDEKSNPKEDIASKIMSFLYNKNKTERKLKATNTEQWKSHQPTDNTTVGFHQQVKLSLNIP
jgi:predicted phosphoadenosine phosphosulfate sulfurtransferase